MYFMDRINLYIKDMFNWSLINKNNNYKNILIYNTTLKTTDNLYSYVSLNNINNYEDIKIYYNKLYILYKNIKKLYKLNNNTIKDYIWIDNLKKNLKYSIDVRFLYNTDIDTKKYILKKTSKIKSLI